MSNPWLKFYPSDWRADPALRMCSLAARGLWMEMLCLMHEADPAGSLLVNGKSVSEKQLAMLVGCAATEIAGLMAELEDAGVFSREADGVIFSRRIRRDVEKARADRENGKRGGNPGLRKGVNPSPNPEDNGGDKAQKPEARSQIDDPKIVDHPLDLGVASPPSAPRKASRAKPRAQIAETAMPTPADVDAAKNAGLTRETMIQQWTKFRDYHRAKGSLMADWSAAWRTWLGNIAQFQQSRAGPAPPAPRRSSIDLAAERLLAESLGLETNRRNSPDPFDGPTLDLAVIDGPYRA